MIFRLSTTILFLFLYTFAFGQNPNLSGTINHYTAVTAMDTCTGRLTVSDTAGFRVGGSVLLVQMKGAAIESPNSAAFGNITSMGQAGKYERCTIEAREANAIFVKHSLLNRYDVPSGLIQLVTIPVFANATVTGTITAKPWDGSTGGIIALDVTGTLTMNAPISADSSGFRGGQSFVASSNNCNFLFPQNAFSYDATNWRGGPKGEGLAPLIAGKENGRGAQANGGGGGNDHNSGGGGGAHLGNGGIGGQNDEPAAAGCSGNFPGQGGKKITDKTGRIFLGGGGGSGHTNNFHLSDGGHGGGIVLLFAGTITGTSPFVTANGQSSIAAGGDGGGGGGAGGTVICKVNTAGPNLLLQANGGNGGTTGLPAWDRCFGPGGGGAGGRIISNVPFSAPSAGLKGIITDSSEPCQGSSNGATDGEVGVFENFGPLPQGNALIGQAVVSQQPAPQTICAGNPFSFSCQGALGGAQYQWESNTGSGWSNVAGGSGYSGFNTPTLTYDQAMIGQSNTLFRCKITRGTCFSLTSDEAVLTVLPSAIAGFTFTVSGNEVNFENTSMQANSVRWDFGDGSFSTNSGSPTHTYSQTGSYTVSLYAYGTCDTTVFTQTITLSAGPPSAEFTVSGEQTGCGPVTLQFSTAIVGPVTEINWFFPNGNPATSQDSVVSVTYTTSGVYVTTLIAQNAAGSSTVSQSFPIQVLSFPTAGFDFDAMVGGLVQFSNLSTQSTTYNWFFGDGATSTEKNPSHQYAENGTYIVTLQVINACGAAVLQKEVTVQVVGTEENNGVSGLKIYPNPATDWLNIEFLENSPLPYSIRVCDVAGKILWEKNSAILLKEQIDVSLFPKSCYILTFETEKGTINKKFVK